MFNLLAKFDNRVLEGFITQGHSRFVRQTFNQVSEVFDTTTKAHFLICHYKDAAKAKEHFDVLTDDANRFLYSCDEPKHQQRLKAGIVMLIFFAGFYIAEAKQRQDRFAFYA